MPQGLFLYHAYGTVITVMDVETTSSGGKSPEISDAQRLEASTRQTTLTPLNQNITADEQPAEVTVNQHIINGPIGNSPAETESTVGTGNGIIISSDVSKPYAIVGVGALVIGAIAAMVVIVW